MALAVLLPIRVTQKHRAQNLKIIFRKKEGRSSLQRLSEIGHCSHCTYRKKATENIPKTSSAAKVRLGNAPRVRRMRKRRRLHPMTIEALAATPTFAESRD